MKSKDARLRFWRRGGRKDPVATSTAETEPVKSPGSPDMTGPEMAAATVPASTDGTPLPPTAQGPAAGPDAPATLPENPPAPPEDPPALPEDPRAVPEAPAASPEALAAVAELRPKQPPTRATLPLSSPLAPRREGPLVGGIDLGGTKIAAAVIGPDHEVIAYRRRPTPDRGGPANVVRAMAVAIQEAAEDAGTEAHRLRAVGVGAPGSVDPKSGAVSGAANLPGWTGRFQLGMALRDAIGTPVTVGNDVQVAIRAEYELGSATPFGSLLGVFWGTGVGGGLILDGEPWTGRGRAGEIGHTLVRRKGARATNGPDGTVEAYAGRLAMEEKARREMRKGRDSRLFEIMKEQGKEHLTSSVWHHAMKEQDELALDLLNRACRALSAGIASAVNLLDVEAVLIGGGLGMRFADTLVPRIFEGMSAYLLEPDNPPATRVASLGDQAGVLGASLLVR